MLPLELAEFKQISLIIFNYLDYLFRLFGFN